MLDLRPVDLVGEQLVVDRAEDALVKVALLVVGQDDSGKLVQLLRFPLDGLTGPGGDTGVHEPLAQQAHLSVRGGDDVGLPADRQLQGRVEELVEVLEGRHGAVTGFSISTGAPWPLSLKLNGSRSVELPPLVKSLTVQVPW